MRKKRLHMKVLKTVILLLAAFVFVLPLLWMLSSSLKTPLTVFSSPFQWIPEVLHWENYVKIWNNESFSFLRAYANSLFIVAVSTVGQILIASLAAYAFAKIDFRGKTPVFMIFMASMMIPAQVTLIPTFMLFKTLGLYNNLWAVILPNWFNVTAIFMLRQFYIGLPNELCEAAKVDGAGHFRIFFRILMPLTKPAMVSLSVLSFVTTWNDYLYPLIFLTNKKFYTVALGIRWYLLDEAQEYNLTMAAATVALVPIVILFVFCQKYFVEGIATSGVKG